ncbi:HU family DNA-binding protein [Thalassovita taeanensis]|uniref:DNA-binding protein HU-alpha n=1 Tax=Thalassovita taeanensis TaxID=657014 RepID=A0A1H9KS42_9RHOB|nr:HU family DNA-binding protein [Thalassovita taeanensis]SER01942.1 DNA-binding protein HU-alpha [Thalassovita taeanensis]
MARATTPATTSTRTTTRKTPARKPRATAPAVEAPEPVVVNNDIPVVLGMEMKKRELIELVVERAGVKKKDAKPAIEAMLQILGEALADSREMNLPPLGKIKINRIKQLSNAKVITCKLRRNDAAVKAPTEPLAEPTDPLADAAE